MSDDAILIIDDDPDLRDLVRFVSESTDVAVVEAATCAEGIAALRANRERIRLVLLDYFMPGMEPACCARALCELASSTIIVLCTAAVDPAERAKEVGLSRWLAKPFDLEALETLLREAARQHDDAAPCSSGEARLAGSLKGSPSEVVSEVGRDHES